MLCYFDTNERQKKIKPNRNIAVVVIQVVVTGRSRSRFRNSTTCNFI